MNPSLIAMSLKSCPICVLFIKEKWADSTLDLPHSNDVPSLEDNLKLASGGLGQTLTELKARLLAYEQEKYAIESEIKLNIKYEPSLTISNTASAVGTIATVEGAILLSLVPFQGWSTLAGGSIIAAIGLLSSIYKLYCDDKRQHQLNKLEAKRTRIKQAIDYKKSEIQTRENQQGSYFIN